VLGFADIWLLVASAELIAATIGRESPATAVTLSVGHHAGRACMPE
jgi:hypothetical protein